MPLNQARIELYTYINTNWTTTALVFAGDDRKIDQLMKGTSPWINSNIIWQDEFQKSHPSPNILYGRDGMFITKVFVRKADGEGSLYTIVDTLCDLVRNKRIGNVQVSTSKIARSANDDIWNMIEVISDIEIYYSKSISF